MVNLNIVSVSNKSEVAAKMTESAERTKGQYSCKYSVFDNSGNKLFHSAAEAYNSFLRNDPDGEVFVFCHQDILFSGNALQELYNLCIENPDTLFGTAGIKRVGHADPKRILSYQAGTLDAGRIEDVFTLDECLICGNRRLFESVAFDENVCNGWHLYAADLAMQCHVKGLSVKVFGAEVMHLSGGVQDKSFYACERKLVKKYRGVFPVIFYTCGWAFTDPIRYTVLRIYRRLRYGTDI